MLRFFGRAHNAVVKLLGLTALSVGLLWGMCRYPIERQVKSPLPPPAAEVDSVAAHLPPEDDAAKVLFIPAIQVAPIAVPTLTQPAYLARCLDVPPAKVNGIGEGLTVSGDGSIDITTAQAVKSNHFASVYFIAAAIHGPGMGDNGQIGIWASNSLEVSNGVIYAVDGMANEFSDWGDGRTTDFHLSLTDDGAQEAKSCVTYKQRR